jgi:hypothetical protein
MAKKPRDVPHYERPLPSQEEPFIELIMTLRAKNGELYRTLVKGQAVSHGIERLTSG